MPGQAASVQIQCSLKVELLQISSSYAILQGTDNIIRQRLAGSLLYGPESYDLQAASPAPALLLILSSAAEPCSLEPSQYLPLSSRRASDRSGGKRQLMSGRALQ